MVLKMVEKLLEIISARWSTLEGFPFSVHDHVQDSKWVDAGQPFGPLMNEFNTLPWAVALSSKYNASIQSWVKVMLGPRPSSRSEL